jgi:Chaperone of endosialidase
MKRNILFCLTSGFAILSIQVALGQNWETSGNDVSTGEWYGAISSSTQPIQFRHQANGAQSNFQWWTNNGTLAERMRLSQAGFLGLNTGSPLARYHQHQGDFLIMGSYSDNVHPTIGTGPLPDGNIQDRLMWIDSRAALRVGGLSVGGDFYWDIDNIGSYSMALGYANMASDRFCICLGAANLAESESAVCLGSSNQASGVYCHAYGKENSIYGANSFGIGQLNDVNGENSLALGYFNKIILADAAYALGFGNEINSSLGVTLGKSNLVTSNGEGSALLGCFLESDAEFNTVIGACTDDITLSNDLPYSLMIGYNSDFPTMLVTGGDGNAGSYGRVGIGTLTPDSRLHVYNEIDASQATQTIEAINTSGATNQGLFISTTGGTGANICVEGSATGTVGSTVLTGGKFNVSSGSKVWGIEANASNSGSSGSGNAIGVIGTATNTSEGRLTIGVYGKATNSACGQSRTIGVYGEASPVNSGTCFANYPGYFVGSIVTTGGAISISDQTLKTGEVQISNGLEKVLQLQPYTYYYASETAGYLGLNDELAAGFMAQQMQEVIPEAVKEVMAPLIQDDTYGLVSTDQTYLGIQYNALIPYLTAAIQEQQTQIEELKASINECCGIELKSMQEENNGTSTDVKLSASQPILFQNTPNPHKGTCVIRYFVPSLNQKAEVQFFEANGCAPCPLYPKVWAS